MFMCLLTKVVHKGIISTLSVSIIPYNHWAYRTYSPGNTARSKVYIARLSYPLG